MSLNDMHDDIKINVETYSMISHTLQYINDMNNNYLKKIFL